MNFLLYSLNDENNMIRYIGITTKTLNKRLSWHINSCRTAFSDKNIGKYKHHRYCWIYSLLKKGIKPSINLIKEYNSIEELKEAEINYILYYKNLGYNLVNSTEGGDGIKGYKYHTISKSKIKICQYSLDGELIKIHDSLTEAAKEITGSGDKNSKLSNVARGKRRMAYGYIWRYENDPFDKYKTTCSFNVTLEQKIALSKRQKENNVMKNKNGVLNKKSIYIIIIDENNIITNMFESIRETAKYFNKSDSFVKNRIYHLIDNNSFLNHYFIRMPKDIASEFKQDVEKTRIKYIGTKYSQ